MVIDVLLHCCRTLAIGDAGKMTYVRPLGSSLRFGGAQTPFPPFDVIFGTTQAMLDVRRRLELVSGSDVPVLLQGESGTGKDLCAQLVHAFSARHRNSFIKVSCPAIPHSLLETEIFGYEKGAFTGANAGKRGRVEQADGGTLVLDEVGSLDVAAQAKLLQLLQDSTFTRVGGHDPISISTRIISIANNDLRDQVAAGTFRLDLLYRINAVTINLVPLRQRRVDIPLLVDHFSKVHAGSFRVSPKPISKEVVQIMQTYEWPGNIRQLDNLIRSYSLIGDEDLILSEVTPRSMRSDQVTAEIDLSKPFSLKQITKNATRDLEKQIILKVLHANGWNRQKTAKWLDISYRSLLYKLNEVGIHEHLDEDQESESALPSPDRFRSVESLDIEAQANSTQLLRRP